MRTTIDAAGRVVIPKERPVAVPAEALPPLTDEIVRETLDRVRR
jgi:hypothetical protein